MKKILIIGQGNIGTMVGAALNSSHQITHYVKDGGVHSKEVVLNFVDRRSSRYKIKRGATYSYHAIETLEKISTYDFIIVPVAHYHLRVVLDTIKPYLLPHQAIVIMGNVWDDFEWLQNHLGNSYVFAFPNFGGAIVDQKIQGWLSPSFTTGVTNMDS